MKRYQNNYAVGKSDRALIALDVQKTSNHVDASMEIGATIGFLSKWNLFALKKAAKEDPQLLNSHSRAATEAFSMLGNGKYIVWRKAFSF